MAVRFMDEEKERQAEKIAYGLFCLDLPLHARPTVDRWRQAPEIVRDLYMSRARFVLSCAGDLP